MSDPTDDIDALLAFLQDGCDFGCECGSETAKLLHGTLTALVAERDALKQRVALLESQEFTLPSDPFRDPDRELRGRLVCAALTGILSNSNFNMGEEASASWVVAYADAALAAMRKGEA